MRKLLKNPKTMGQVLMDSVNAALSDVSRGRVVRPKINVPAIRKELSMTQKQFAEKYHIKLETLKNCQRI